MGYYVGYCLSLGITGDNCLTLPIVRYSIVIDSRELLTTLLHKNMKIIYGNLTGRYHVSDKKGNWYATGHTMIEAIQHGISNVFYWHNINK